LKFTQALQPYAVPTDPNPESNFKLPEVSIVALVDPAD